MRDRRRDLVGIQESRTARATRQLDSVITRIGRSADALDQMAGALALAGTNVATSVGAVGADTDRFTAATLPEIQGLLGELRELSASLRRLSEQTTQDPASLLRGRRSLPDGAGEKSSERTSP